jgi:hypothetical protein
MRMVDFRAYTVGRDGRFTSGIVDEGVEITLPAELSAPLSAMRKDQHQIRCAAR